MDITITSGRLTAVISSAGGELQSLRDAAGLEYLWQGDKRWWGRRSPNLFPYVGRCTGGQYTLEGQTYSLDIHGFVRGAELQGERLEDSACVFTLTDSPETRARFPFAFRYQVAFTAQENTLTVTYTVENRDSRTMYFGLGAHPGFQVPLGTGERFEDYVLTFSAPCAPRRVLFSAEGYRTGETADYPLQNGDRIPLTHPLFDDEAIVLALADPARPAGGGGGFRPSGGPGVPPRRGDLADRLRRHPGVRGRFSPKTKNRGGRPLAKEDSRPIFCSFPVTASRRRRPAPPAGSSSPGGRRSRTAPYRWPSPPARRTRCPQTRTGRRRGRPRPPGESGRRRWRS